MKSFVINIKNDTLVPKEDIEDLKLLKETKNENKIPLDEYLKNEVEDRIKAYDEGKMKKIPSSEIFSKYQK